MNQNIILTYQYTSFRGFIHIYRVSKQVQQNIALTYQYTSFRASVTLTVSLNKFDTMEH